MSKFKDGIVHFRNSGVKGFKPDVILFSDFARHNLLRHHNNLASVFRSRASCHSYPGEILGLLSVRVSPRSHECFGQYISGRGNYCWILMLLLFYVHSLLIIPYCAFNIFQEVDFVWRFSKKWICKFLLLFNAKPFFITTYAQTVIFYM